MEFLKNILDGLFFALPLLGGISYLAYLAIKEEVIRTDEYRKTMSCVREFVMELHAREFVDEAAKTKTH